MTTLDLALIGNGAVGALVSARADIVWTCFPRFDGDPVFCSLLRGPDQSEFDGAFAIEMIGSVRSEQSYALDTPILVTRFFDGSGAAIEVTDFAPRTSEDGGIVAPAMLVRRIRRIAGAPAIRVRLRPMRGYGAQRIMPQPRGATTESGGKAKQLRYQSEDITLVLTTDAPLDAVVNETGFPLDESVTLMLSLDEEMTGDAAKAGDDLLDRTRTWWHEWVGALTVPAEWRDEVVRAAITLELNVAAETGAIIAAMTTSIPEARNSNRNWDYRYCWLRDSYFVVAALNRLGDTATTAGYVEFVMGIVAAARGAPLAPLYTIMGGRPPEEHEAVHLQGYRGMGPVRIGNKADEQIQHDVYGEVILAALPLFNGSALSELAGVRLFNQLEPLGDLAADFFDKPDAGLWELRGVQRVHTFSSVMCWAACDALSRIASQLRIADRAKYWRELADNIHQVVSERSWNARLGAFTATMNGDTLDASLLLMQPLGFLRADDPRYAGTVRAIGRDLRRGEFIYRYVEKDDFGEPENAFLVCTFWYVDALAAIGDRDEAHRLFEHLLSCRNPHGLLAEHLDPQTREQWGNFVQTYSMAGMIDSAIRLSAL